MGEATRDDGETRLATFERRNRDTGNIEEIRITAAEWNGKLLVGIRVWYRARPDGPEDDGWRPSKIGCTIREHELDTWAGAIGKAQAMLAERPGRNTRESQRDRPPTRRGPWQSPPHQRSEVYRPQPLPNRLPTPRATEFDEFDDEAG